MLDWLPQESISIPGLYFLTGVLLTFHMWRTGTEWKLNSTGEIVNDFSWGWTFAGATLWPIYILFLVGEKIADADLDRLWTGKPPAELQAEALDKKADALMADESEKPQPVRYGPKEYKW